MAVSDGIMHDLTEKGLFGGGTSQGCLENTNPTH